MQSDLQLERPTLTSYPRNQPLNSFFNLIKLKKAQFAKDLQSLDSKQISLPTINQEKSEQFHLKAQQPNNISYLEIEHEKQSFGKSFQKNPHNKYRMILDQMQNEKEKISQRQPLQYRVRQSNKSTTMEPKNYSIKTQSRIKTQTQPKVTKKPNTSSSITKNKEHEIKYLQYEQSIKCFCHFVIDIPKNMKMRNQDNLTDTISQLQIFNPFFNRNNRIINVCLIKMGRIVHKIGPIELYKAGEVVDYFYIILFGRVKLVEGPFKRVCETGETLLQQVLFAPKPKKVAFQRAKSLGSTYLLQMKTEQFKKLKEELIHYGLKLSYQEMETIIKRNYIIKNWMRSKNRIDLK